MMQQQQRQAQAGFQGQQGNYGAGHYDMQGQQGKFHLESFNKKLIISRVSKDSAVFIYLFLDLNLNGTIVTRRPDSWQKKTFLLYSFSLCYFSFF